MLRSSLKLSLLNNQILIWCFSFVTLFNLQGTRRSRRRAFILPHLVRFVKNFFRVFSNSFVLSSAAFAVAGAVLADSLIRLPHFRAFVKHFFQPGSNFFCLPPGLPSAAPSALPPGLSPSEERLLILANTSSLVNTFFSLFSPFFTLPLHYTISSTSPPSPTTISGPPHLCPSVEDKYPLDFHLAEIPRLW